jgi:hypothetical protein
MKKLKLIFYYSKDTKEVIAVSLPIKGVQHCTADIRLGQFETIKNLYIVASNRTESDKDKYSLASSIFEGMHMGITEAETIEALCDIQEDNIYTYITPEEGSLDEFFKDKKL